MSRKGRKREWTDSEVGRLLELYEDHTYKEIKDILNEEFNTNHTANAVRKAYERYSVMPKKTSKFNPPKILLIDIETAPLVVYSWGVNKQFIGVDDIIEDWSILSYSAKWVGKKKVYYKDTRDKKNVRDDREICEELKILLDEADIIISQNGIRFDVPRIFSKLLEHKLGKPTSFRHIDTCQISQRNFGHTSNKLAYLTAKFTQHEKLKHSLFPGKSLWHECLKGNKKAFNEMKRYNKMDVIVLEELYEVLIPWDNALNFTIYGDHERCSCGNTEFKKSGFHYTNASVFQKYQCTKCGKEYRDTKNLKTGKFRSVR